MLWFKKHETGYALSTIPFVPKPNYGNDRDSINQNLLKLGILELPIFRPMQIEGVRWLCFTGLYIFLFSDTLFKIYLVLLNFHSPK